MPLFNGGGDIYASIASNERAWFCTTQYQIYAMPSSVHQNQLEQTVLVCTSICLHCIHDASGDEDYGKDSDFIVTAVTVKQCQSQDGDHVGEHRPTSMQLLWP